MLKVTEQVSICVPVSLHLSVCMWICMFMCMHVCTGTHVWERQKLMSDVIPFCTLIIWDKICELNLSLLICLHLLAYNPQRSSCLLLGFTSAQPPWLALYKGVGLWRWMLSSAQQAIYWLSHFSSICKGCLFHVCKFIIRTCYNLCRLISGIPRKHSKCIYSVSLSNYGICVLHRTGLWPASHLLLEKKLSASLDCLCILWFFFPSKLLSSSIFLLKCSSLGHLLVMFQYLIFFQNKMSPCFVSKAPPFGKTTEQITAAHIGITLLELISSFALQLKWKWY